MSWSFNGATRLHAWKRPGSSSVTTGRIWLQWSHASSRVETRPSPFDLLLESCFNGATRLHAWKPPPSGPSRASRTRFNGATRLHAWKRRWFRASRSCERRLQWSHASSRVETSHGAPIYGYFVSRFNGATRLHAWKQRLRRCDSRNPVCFNGATRLHAWKPFACRAVSTAPPTLQWSHASSRVETSL